MSIPQRDPLPDSPDLSPSPQEPPTDLGTVLAPAESEEEDEGELQASYDGEISIEKADRGLSELKRWYDDGDLVLDPEWQRNYVWSNPQASRLIESFLLNIPVPVIYIATTSDDQYEVIDGLQRLESTFRFLDNRLKLSGLSILQDLNGKKFKDLDRKHQKKLKNSVLRTFELSKTNSSDMHFIVFERLNTGGTRLNEMEIRNCLFRGPLNNTIKDLAANPDFRKCVSEKTFVNRMKDRSFVLRFLAFYERTHHKCLHGIKRFLNEFMETYRNPPENKLQEYRDTFKHCARAAFTVFGDHAFRLKREVTGKPTAEWSTRSNIVIFQCVATSFAHYQMAAITKNADRIYEEYLDMVLTDERWVDCVRRATGVTERLDYVFRTWNERLKRALAGEIAAPGGRTFSKRLKTDLWLQNATCELCGNAIQHLDDAVIDHIEHYWRGGKTIPENARLTHRFCNLERGGR